ncbi:hypothetical protein chiPu_0033086, partial [Chiloscyllium punctatum]|nr:hypothetical protein [Chiloscyllium punctatum]
MSDGPEVEDVPERGTDRKLKVSLNGGRTGSGVW